MRTALGRLDPIVDQSRRINTRRMPLKSDYMTERGPAYVWLGRLRTLVSLVLVVVVAAARTRRETPHDERLRRVIRSR